MSASVTAADVGYFPPMSNESHEAIQAVVDRVTSYQDGAPEGTVEDELRSGFQESGVDVVDDDVTRLAAAIEARHGAVSVEDVLA
jgi:hypothetical protein